MLADERLGVTTFLEKLAALAALKPLVVGVTPLVVGVTPLVVGVKPLVVGVKLLVVGVTILLLFWKFRLQFQALWL